MQLILARWQVLLTKSLTILASCSQQTLAQEITPDNTLPNNSIITPKGDVVEITGGSKEGNNLFHSFQDFSVSRGNSAFFRNTNNINNIFSRVTGGNVSNINGLIKANGNANLFLINPAGIVFGEGARLNIGGSFFASSASSILFPEDIEFSAINTQEKPLLTVNAPIGLNLDENSGDIAIHDTRLESDRAINLIGGNIDFNAGIIDSQKVIIGGLAAAGIVTVNPDLSLNFPTNIDKSDVKIANSSSLNIFSSGTGFVKIDANDFILDNKSKIIAGKGNNIDLTAANNLELKDRSLIQTQVSSNTVGNAGNINLKADGNINISDRSSVFSLVQQNAQGDTSNITLNASNIFLTNNSEVVNAIRDRSEGNSGNIILNANTINLENRSLIETETASRGKGGNIEINAQETVFLNNGSRIANIVDSIGIGDAGKIDIETQYLSLENNSRIITNTLGEGNAGNIAIDVGEDFKLLNNSKIQAEALSEKVARASAGDIDINTSNLELENNAAIVTTTNKNVIGNSGDISVRVRNNLILTDGSRINSGVLRDDEIDFNSQGNSGDIKVNSSTISLADRSIISASNAGSGNSGSVAIATDSIVLKNFSLIAASSRTNQSQNSGNININTGAIAITTGSIINSSTSSNFSGGEININAETLQILRGGVIQTATGAKGNAGNINLNIAEEIIINGNNPPRRPAKFDFAEEVVNALEGKTGIFANTTNTSNANTSNGGNINIDTKFIIALPDRNSDIIANANRGKGGNINIEANAIFGIALRDSTPANRTNDIDASSQVNGLDGTITLTTPEIDPIKSLIKLPDRVIDASQQISKTCQSKDSKISSRFINIGRGGLPLSPNESLRENAVITSWVDEPKTITSDLTPKNLTTQSNSKIVEAQRWIVNDRGNLELVAESSNMPIDIYCNK